MKKVFVSYASKDPWVRDWLVPLLQGYEVEVLADYLTFKFGVSSLQNIEDSIEEADFTFFVVSPNWVSSEWTELENLIVQTDSPSNRKGTFFVLRLEACDLPKRLKPFTYVDLTDAALQERQIKRLMDQLSIRQTRTPAFGGPRPEHIALSKLPDTSGHLFGRDNELALLDNAWETRKHIICFVAQGGEGKTALTRRWVNLLEQDNFRGAERVYAWSFYSQGTSIERNDSSDLFLAETLTWFGDAAMANGPDSASQKAQRLAALIRQQRTLLVLDGLEPLQHPPGEPHNGRIRDAGIRTLLRELGNSNPGLVVVSTRVWVRELDSFIASGTVVQQRLSRLDRGAGTALLNALGVTKGRQKDFVDAVEEYHGHALALTLLGNLLKDYCEGDVRKRDVVPALEEEDEWGGHARRVLAWYEQHFEGKAELNILRILGLFDRPAEVAVVNALRSGEPIPGITDALQGLSELHWKKATKHLHAMGLLEEGEALDCHPLIREYFAQQLSQQQPEAWKAAHQRLYEYYKALPEKELPDTLEEMEPLYRAMGHGCKAGLYQEALDDVYWKQICRGNVFHSTNILGAFSSDLAAISGFFLTPWREVQSALSDDFRAFLLNQAAFHLRALGRLREAIEPMEASMTMDEKRGDWEGAAISASNLSELRLTLGDVAQAVAYGEASVRHADESGDAFEKIARRTTLADALFQAGRLEEAEALFREAEALQVEDQPEFPMLYSLQGYRFCDLLLGKGDPKDSGWVEVTERAKQTMEWAIAHGFLLDIALDHLSLGRVAHLQALVEGGKDPNDLKFGAAMTHLDQAVDGLRKAGQNQYLPLGLLVRAVLHRTIGTLNGNAFDYGSTQADLAEAYDIAESGEMRLHLTDYHLESARLKIAMGDREAARGHFEKAKELIAETGYHRRDGELEELRVALETPYTPSEPSEGLSEIISETIAQTPKPPQKPQPSPKSDSTHSPQTLRVLILAANPRDLQQLQTMQEAMDILKLLKQGRFVGKIEPLIPVLNLGVEGLIEELSVRPEVVHFSGHGDQNGIYLVDDSGESELVELPTLKLLFEYLGGHTQLVLLNACYSAIQAREVSKFGIYVAGYNRRIRDKAAIAFSKGLYIGLSAGKSVVDSLRDGLALLLHKDATGAEALEVWKDGERVQL